MRAKTSLFLSGFVVMAGMILMLTMAGCGGAGNVADGSGGSGSIVEGNWSIVGASTEMPGQVYRIGGHMAQSGSTLSGKVGMVGPCDPPEALNGIPTVALTGSAGGKQLGFQFGPTASGSVVNGTLAGTATSLTGSFTVSGGCASGDHVSATATRLTPLTGTWTGTGSATTGAPNVQVSVTFTQLGTPNDSGAYFIGGTLNYNSATCTANGVELDGYIAGSNQYFTFDEGAIEPVWFSFIGSLDSPPSATTFTGSYQTIKGFGTVAGCEGDSGTIQFTKQ